MNYLVTGANRGIGFELTSQLLTLGHNVVACVRNPDRTKELDMLVKEYGQQCQILGMDVSFQKSIQQAVSLIKVAHLDVVINSAGVLLNEDANIENLNVVDLNTSLQTNLFGPIHVTRATLKLLKNAKLPKLVNITSVMGSLADNSSGTAYSYRISKAALNMFSKNLAIGEKWLCVLMIHPGWVKTKMGGENALIAPQESAGGMLKVIGAQGLKDSGKFLNFRGEELPW